MSASVKQLAGQTAIYGVSTVIGRFLTFLLVPMYVRVFTASEYGIVTEFYAYVIVLQVLLTYGMETGFFRFSKKLDKPKTVFTTVLTSILLTSASFVSIAILFANSLSDVLGYHDNPEYVSMFALILGLDAVSAIFFAKLRAENKAKKFALIKLLNIGATLFFNIFFLILCPIFFKNNANIIYYPNFGVGYIFLSNLISSFLVLVILLTELKGIKFKFDKVIFKQILLYSLPLLLTGLTGAFNEAADKFFIKLWTVVPPNFPDAHEYITHQLGIYGANAKLALIMMMFVQAFRYAAEPFFFSFAKGNNDNLRIFADVMKYFVILAFVLFLVIMLNLEIFKHFLSPDYFEGLSVVFPLFLSRFLVGVFFVLSFWYKLNDVTQRAIYIFVAGTVLTIVLDYFMIPKYGYLGAAWTNFFAYLLMVIFSFIWSRKYMKVNYQYMRLLIYISIPLIFYFLSTFIDFQSLLVTLSVKNLFIFLYLLLILKVEKIKYSDLQLVLNKILKK